MIYIAASTDQWIASSDKALNGVCCVISGHRESSLEPTIELKAVVCQWPGCHPRVVFRQWRPVALLWQELPVCCHIGGILRKNRAASARSPWMISVTLSLRIG